MKYVFIILVVIGVSIFYAFAGDTWDKFGLALGLFLIIFTLEEIENLLKEIRNRL